MNTNFKKFAQARSAGAEITAIDGSLPLEIQFMPPGVQTIVPLVHGEPLEMTVDVGPRYAEIFQECLSELQSRARAGECDEPFLDFNHEDGRASAVPKKFSWGGDDPKRGGVRLEVEWTGSGKEALLNRDYRRFSPQWIFHKDTREPLGLEVNMGGLVNKAAFKTISPVMASGKSVAVTAAFTEQHKTGSAGSETESNNSMTKDELSQVIADALKPIGDRLTTLESRIPGVKATAKSALQKHIARGAIPPGDTSAIEFWEKALIADATSAEEQLCKIKGNAANLRVINGRASDTISAGGVDPEETFMAKAKEYAGTFKIEDHAVAIARFAETAEGQALYHEFRNTKVVKGN